MANENTAPEAGATTAPAAPIQTVLGDMESRRIFDTPVDAVAYLAKCQSEYSDFDSIPFIAKGVTIDDEGQIEFDPEIYNDSMRVAIATLTKRGAGTSPSTVQCISVWPAPTMSAILATQAGTDWLAGIMEKELNHVAVRNLRKAGMPTEANKTVSAERTLREMLEAIDSMPGSIEDYTTSSREASGGIVEAYNSLWKTIRDLVGTKAKMWRIRNLSKKEMRKAMESASYAAAVYATLEGVTDKEGNPKSLFVNAANLGILLAKRGGLDPTIFERMIANRDEAAEYTADDEEEEGEFDLEALAATLDEPAPAEPAPAEPATA